MKIVLFKGRGLLSFIIRTVTRSHYSHAAVLLKGGDIIEAWHSGVRRKFLYDFNNVDVFSVHVDDEEKIIKFLESKIGFKYDFSSVFKFLTKRQVLQSDEKYFCSELIFEAFQEAGINLLERIEAWAVSPGLLALSPYLKVSKSYYVANRPYGNTTK